MICIDLDGCYGGEGEREMQVGKDMYIHIAGSRASPKAQC